jgi:hypothetical protein
VRFGISEERKIILGQTKKKILIPMPLVSYSCCSVLIVDSINALRDAYCGVFCR